MSSHEMYEIRSMPSMQTLPTHDIELGTAEVLQKHLTRHVAAPRPVSQRRLNFEHARPRWLREMVAEATGVFFYVYPGIAATAAFTLSKADPGYGSILTIGLAYGFGIVLAIICCSSTSGGHFNPAITLCFAIWQGFPWRKVPYYIFAQIAGAFFAGLILMAQYHVQIDAYRASLQPLHLGDVFMGGPASIITMYPQENQNNQGWLVLIEFFVDSFIGLVIWSVLDPSNPFITPTIAPFIIGLAYCLMVWGFAHLTISTNLAKDLGCRLVATIFYGSEAFTYKGYWWISFFVNIPATFFATCFYEAVFRDSLDRIGLGHAGHEDGEEGLIRHLERTGMMDSRDRLLIGKVHSQSSRRY